LRKIFRAVIVLLALLGALLVVISTTPFVKWWGAHLAGEWNDPNGDVLVVLGGGVLDPGVLASNSYWRATYALWAWQAGHFRYILLSGSGDPQTPVADLMADYLKFHGVPAGAILVENHSASTRENALFTKPILEKLSGRKVLLTSDYHMYRALRCFHKIGVDLEPRPFPDAIKRGNGWTSRWSAFTDLIIETAKIGYYWKQGWI
jgi:uncharacterized SAM-binding protein YcdF (DUF218 family)